MQPAVERVAIVRVGPSGDEARPDAIAVEEPLEIRLGGQAFAVIMRTPGADQALAAGFLLSEGIVRCPSDIAAMRVCAAGGGAGTLDGQPESESGNVLNVWLSGDASLRAASALAGRRHVTANSACGVCGRRSIDDLLSGLPPLTSDVTVSRAVVSALPESLRAAQAVFEATGGLHAAGLFDAEGGRHALAEDVGRHNAVDKVLGLAMLDGALPLSSRILFVSGRTSFEIVQKAIVAGVPIVASVSAPSSLAVRLARDAGLTLIGFVRGQAFNVYSGGARVAS